MRSLAANCSFARAAASAVLGFTLSAPTGCVRFGFTALVFAAEHGHARVVEVLIAAGAAVSNKTNSGYGPRRI